jgi:hypothetical protein
VETAHTTVHANQVDLIEYLVASTKPSKRNWGGIATGLSHFFVTEHRDAAGLFSH